MSYKTLEHDEGFEIIEDWVKNGIPKGLSAGWPEWDSFFTIKKGQLNVVSGYPSSGKSEFVEAIACNLALKNKWNITMYSPEKYPIQSQQLSLMEKIAGNQIVRRGPGRVLTDDERYKAEFIVKKRFTIISADEDAYSFEAILAGIQQRYESGEKIDMVILDPWNELENGRPSNMTETDYIGVCLRDARRLARRLNISFWIVAHPSKPAIKDKDGKYPVPDLYDLSGSSHWRNKADNGIIVHRYTLEGTAVHVFVRKIKDRFYGKPGEKAFNFLPNSGRYETIKEEF